MSKPVVDPDYLAAEIAADAEILEELREHGDIATMVRQIDLHFKGGPDQIQALAEDADDLPFTFVEFGEYEDGDLAADFMVLSPVTKEAMADLVRQALEIELTYGVQYDGWGCEAQTGAAN